MPLLALQAFQEDTREKTALVDHATMPDEHAAPGFKWILWFPWGLIMITASKTGVALAAW